MREMVALTLNGSNSCCGCSGWCLELAGHKVRRDTALQVSWEAITSGNGGLGRKQWAEMLQEARSGSKQMV